MSSDMSREERVRERAYQLWEAAGRPDGQADQYWHEAVAELAAQEDEPGTELPANIAGETETSSVTE